MALSLELLITAPHVLIAPQLSFEAIQKLPLDGAVIVTFEYCLVFHTILIHYTTVSLQNYSMQQDNYDCNVELKVTPKCLSIYWLYCSKAMDGRMDGVRWMDPQETQL